MPNHQRIGCFIYNDSTFWSMIAHGVTNAAAEFGATVEVLSAPDADGQDRILTQMINQRVDAMIIGVIDPIRGAQSARAAAKVGIPVIAVVAELPDMTARTSVCVDDINGAQLGAEYLAKGIGYTGAIAHFQGALEIRTAVNRSNGFHAAIKRHPDIQVVYEREGHDWSYEAGQHMAQEAITAHPELAGIFAAGDSMALGALHTIEAAGRAGDIMVVGFDGQPEGLAAIHAGRLSASVDQPAYEIGWTAGNAVRSLWNGESVPPVITIPSRLITRENLLDSAMQIVRIMPGLFHSLIENSETQRKLQADIIHSQNLLIQELSAPILPLTNDIIALPLIGTIDSHRAGQITEHLLNTLSRTKTRVVIVDISGISVIDTSVANHLLKASAASRLLGVTMILVGISPEVAQTMVQLGIDLSGIVTFATMRDGLAYAQAAQPTGFGRHSHPVLSNRPIRWKSV